MSEAMNISAEENMRQMRSRFDAVNQASADKRQVRYDAAEAHDAEEKRRRLGPDVASGGGDTAPEDADGMDENDSLGG